VAEAFFDFARSRQVDVGADFVGEVLFDVATACEIPEQAGDAGRK
jgi:hypothetical protein